MVRVPPLARLAAIYRTSGVGMGKLIADRDMKLGICVHLLISLLMFAFSRVSDSPSEGKQGDGLRASG